VESPVLACRGTQEALDCLEGPVLVRAAEHLLAGLGGEAVAANCSRYSGGWASSQSFTALMAFTLAAFLSSPSRAPSRSARAARVVFLSLASTFRTVSQHPRSAVRPSG